MEKPKGFVHVTFPSEFDAGVLHVGRLRIPISVIYTVLGFITAGFVAYGIYGMFTLPMVYREDYVNQEAPDIAYFVYTLYWLGAVAGVVLLMLMVKYFAWVGERFRTASRLDI